MKTKLLLSLLLLTLACAHAPSVVCQEAAGQSQAPAWSRYTYLGEEFSVELPSMPGGNHTSRLIRYTPYDSDKMRVFNLYSGGG
ncbi:MAG: hypothetical protein ABW208_08040 [Pyrinomonadaceae bacterium]